MLDQASGLTSLIYAAQVSKDTTSRGVLMTTASAERAGLAARPRIVLLAAEGTPHVEIARLVRVSEASPASGQPGSTLLWQPRGSTTVIAYIPGVRRKRKLRGPIAIFGVVVVSKAEVGVLQVRPQRSARRTPFRRPQAGGDHDRTRVPHRPNGHDHFTDRLGHGPSGRALVAGACHDPLPF